MAYYDDFRTVPDMLVRTARIWPDRTAYSWYDYRTNAWISLTWREFSERVLRWRKAFAAMGLKRGDRVAMLLPNCVDALIFDQAVLANGLVPVPLHAIDSAGSSCYILNDSGAKALVTVNFARWNSLVSTGTELEHLQLVVLTHESESGTSQGRIPYCGVEEWLATGNEVTKLPEGPEPGGLAALVYTSGTTGRPKGVMLTHENVVANTRQVLKRIHVTEDDVYLSFLPLSHTFERTVTYYAALGAGAQLAISRGVSSLTSDFTDVNPTIFCTVPRVLERIHNSLMLKRRKMPSKVKYVFDWARQAGWRRFCRTNGLPVESSPRAFLDTVAWPFLNRKAAAQIRGIFGSRMRLMIAGGAALNYSVARFFCAMGVPLVQGYGLTESSPVISVGIIGRSHPETVGEPLDELEVRIGEGGELQVTGPQVMKGYWNRPADTAAVFTEDGWLRTGDIADLNDGGRVHIRGRLKEIIVTSTGEKISPVDLEFAILEDPLFDQVMVVGENRPYIACLAVVNREVWESLCRDLALDPTDPSTMGSRDARTAVLKRVRTATKDFPRYGHPRNVAIIPDSWTVENGLLTTTMKLRRRQIAERYASEIQELFTGHDR